jgi:hypothetical protein
MAGIVGLAKAKINGMFYVDVKNARWDVARNVTQHITGGGVKESVGVALVSGSFDEVIAKQGAIDWAALKDFSVEVFDSEDNSVVVLAAEGCNWDKVSGTTDLAQATTMKNVTWKGTVPTKF